MGGDIGIRTGIIRMPITRITITDIPIQLRNKSSKNRLTILRNTTNKAISAATLMC